MWLKGDISIILEFAKKDWDAVPFGVAFVSVAALLTPRPDGE